MEPMSHSESNPMMIFLTCQQIEKTCSAIYREFARMYQKDVQAQALFTKMAQEEDEHAAHFELLYPISTASAVELLVDLPRATGALRTMEHFLQQVQAANNLQLQEALRLSIQAEENLQVFHAGLVADVTNAEWRALLEKLNFADLNHVEKLKEFQLRRSGSF